MILADEQATAACAISLAPLLGAGDVVALSGDLGAGKTTFVRHLLAALGHSGEVPSPSFAIVQPYEELEPPLWHVDLFRIADPLEMTELGLDSLDDSILVIEWPERAGAEAWPEALRFHFAILPGGQRALTVETPAAWEGRWPPR